MLRLGSDLANVVTAAGPSASPLGVPTDPSSEAAAARGAAAVTAARSATPKPAAPRPAAPVSREPPSANGSTTQRRVSLSLEQQETAMFSYPAAPGESEDAHRKRALGTYAREYLKAKAEGKIGRLSH